MLSSIIQYSDQLRSTGVGYYNTPVQHYSKDYHDRYVTVTPYT